MSNFETPAPNGSTTESPVKLWCKKHWMQALFVIIVVLLIVSWIFGIQIDIQSRRYGWSTVSDKVAATEPAGLGDDFDETDPSLQGPLTLDDYIMGEGKTEVDDDVVIGNADAKVTMIEFSDYQCPFCQRHFLETYPKLKENYIDTGKMKVVFRDNPLTDLHPEAFDASMASECAGDQGKFSEYHDALFEKQDLLKKDGAFVDIAKDLKLNEATFTKCMEDETHKEEVEKDMADALELGLTGTPGFVIKSDIPLTPLPKISSAVMKASEALTSLSEI